ncbi:Hypothetical protein MVR_LOCUS211 [uncultured virus]|nr:Hypothetical protein MVR_LOCUS211 [uncultured virus]
MFPISITSQAILAMHLIIKYDDQDAVDHSTLPVISLQPTPNPQLIKYGYAPSYIDTTLQLAASITQDPNYKYVLPISLAIPQVQDILTDHIKSPTLPKLELIELVREFMLTKDVTMIANSNTNANTNPNAINPTTTPIITISEDSIIMTIMTYLDLFYKHHEQGKDIVIQVFSIQTDSLIELLFHFASYYTDVYFYKPEITFETSQVKYMVLKNAKPNMPASSSTQRLKFKPNMQSPAPSYIRITSSSQRSVFNQMIKHINEIECPIIYATYSNMCNQLTQSVFQGSTLDDYVDKQVARSKSYVYRYFVKDALSSITLAPTLQRHKR